MGMFVIGVVVGLMMYPLVPKKYESYEKRKIKEMKDMFK